MPEYGLSADIITSPLLEYAAGVVGVAFGCAGSGSAELVLTTLFQIPGAVGKGSWCWVPSGNQTPLPAAATGITWYVGSWIRPLSSACIGSAASCAYRSDLFTVWTDSLTNWP